MDTYWEIRHDWREAVQDSALPNVVQPNEDSDTVNFLNPEPPCEKWASLSTIRKGTYEYLTVYCNMHGCKKMKKSSVMPGLNSNNSNKQQRQRQRQRR